MNQQLKRALLLSVLAAFGCGRPDSQATADSESETAAAQALETTRSILGRVAKEAVVPLDCGRGSTLERHARRLPVVANDELVITDATGSMEIGVRLDGANDSAGSRQGCVRVYADARGKGQSWILAPIQDGIEDFVRLDPHSDRTASWRVSLGGSVAGLRMVEGIVEFLDASGTPKLRMHAPLAASSSGQTLGVTVSVQGCNVDQDPRAPWGRPVVEPGARTCLLRASVQPPDDASDAVILDPSWTSTGSLAIARSRHQAVMLPDGKVIAIGGYGSVTHPKTCELYDPVTGTWAATGAMSSARVFAGVTSLADGRVLVVGGSAGLNTLASAEIYSHATGAWTLTTSLPYGLDGLALATLPSGKILEIDSWGARLFDPVASQWSSTAAPLYIHMYPSATVLSDGSVLVVGDNVLAERYLPQSGAWVPAGTMAHKRYYHTATRLQDGRVLVSGGRTNQESLNAAEVFSLSDNSWTSLPPMHNTREGHGAALLPDGRALIAGGAVPPGIDPRNTEVYDPVGNAWINVGMLKSARTDHTLTSLGAGRVLATGGSDMGVEMSSAEVFQLAGLGASCTISQECASRFCVDGVCCDSACAGSCMACSNALKGTGQSGICGPIAAGLDPQSECPAEAAATCQWNGYCDGAGACMMYASGTVCQSACSSGTATVSKCDGNGACVLQSPVSCFPYACAATGACATQCFGSSQCAEGAFCGSNNKCQQAMPAGQSCSQASQCASGHCVEGVCCDQTCGELCRSCLAARKGGGADGTCGPVAVGTDPDEECPDDGASTCQGNGLCDGAGACQKYAQSTNCTAMPCTGNGQCSSGHCVDGVCCDRACDGVCESCLASRKGSGTDGACGPVKASTDPDDDCVDEFDTCGKSGACDGAGKCALHVSGSTGCSAGECDESTDCATGFCVDGLCCNDACKGECRTCSATATGQARDGLCGNVIDGLDPMDDCAASPGYPGSCGADGTCDGTGRCRALAKPATVCAPSKCADGSLTAFQCHLGSCVGVPDSCGAYSGCADASSCAASCSGSTECAQDYHCDAGKCVPNLANGKPCSIDSECASSHCADGVCCSSACDRQCEACNEKGGEGACIAVTGAPRGGRAPCVGDPACQVQCDGDDRDTCRVQNAGGDCGSTCEGEHLARKLCSPQGACLAQPTALCAGHLACDSSGSACRTKCKADADCAAGAKCDIENGRCVVHSSCADDYNIQRGSAVESCNGYKCVAGTCQQHCTDQCAPGFTCYKSFCVTEQTTPPQPIVEVRKSCGCSVPGRTRPSGWAILALAVPAMAMRWRRRLRAGAGLFPALLVSACSAHSELDAGEDLAREGSASAVTGADSSLLQEMVTWAGAAPASQAPRNSQVQVILPGPGNDPVKVQRGASWIAFALQGASSSALRQLPGGAVHRDALGRNNHHVMLNLPSGIEDFVRLDSGGNELRYRVSLGSGIEGVRIVDRVVEFLDGSGVPQLRMARPFVVDARHQRREAQVASPDCRVDTDPRPPWNRRIHSPGARQCEIVLSWSPAGLTAPMLVDPAWTSASDMSTTREAYDLALLSGGEILAAGGRDELGKPMASAEVYDPDSDAWAVVAPMTFPRSSHTLSPLASNKALAVAGYGGYESSGHTFRSDAEVYDASTGTWAWIAGSGTARANHTATVLANGSVLFAGGSVLASSGAVHPLQVDVSDASGTAWTTAGSLPAGRIGHTSTLLADGSLLIAGGAEFSVGMKDCHRYLPGTGWTEVGELSIARSNHAAARGLDGRVLVAGGSKTSTTEWFDPATGTWSPGPAMSIARDNHTATTLVSGQILIVGAAQADLVTATGSQILDAGPLLHPRDDHRASLLPDGSVLVAGGKAPAGRSAERFRLLPEGAQCSARGQCHSGFCVDGVCCDSACAGLCVACVQSKTKSADGACAPVSVGTDPENECKDDGAPQCTLDGTCDGSGACAKYSTSSGCVPRSCATGSECTSGHCADGICCDTECEGPCLACRRDLKGQGSDGVCGAVLAGTDPDSDCEQGPGYPSSCLQDGTCDGDGSCRAFALAGTACKDPACGESVLVSFSCNGAGQCLPAASPCGGGQYRCASATACATSCDDSSSCTDSSHCSGGECVADAPARSSCSSHEECASGYCIDGYCCDSPCTGNCEACDVAGKEGTCSAVTGAPHGARPDCGSDPICGGRCDGAERAVCSRPGPEKQCGGTCTDLVLAVARCDGAGKCIQGAETLNCEPYACDSLKGTCRTDCQIESDCAPGAICATGTCQPTRAPQCKSVTTSISPDGQERSCYPYACSAGRCLDTCNTEDDCSPGATCAIPHCKPADADAGSAAIPANSTRTECACSLPGGGSNRPIWVTLLACVLAGGALRRAGRRQSP